MGSAAGRGLLWCCKPAAALDDQCREMGEDCGDPAAPRSKKRTVRGEAKTDIEVQGDAGGGSQADSPCGARRCCRRAGSRCDEETQRRGRWRWRSTIATAAVPVSLAAESGGEVAAVSVGRAVSAGKTW